MNVLARITLNVVVPIALLGVLPSTALALTEGDKEAVRNLSDEAADDYDHQRFAQARDKFTRAYSVAKIPSLALWTARANEKLGKWVAAYEMYNEVLTLERNELWRGDAQQKAQQDAARELSFLTQRIPRLTVRLEGADVNQASVTIDGIPIPTGLLGVERFADPGQHVVAGQAGALQASESVKLTEGARATVVLQLKPKPASLPAQATPTTPQTPPTAQVEQGIAPPSPAADQGPELSSSESSNHQRLWGWVAVGVGGVGLVTGTATGIIVASKHSDLKNKCGDELRCPVQYESDVDSYRTMRTVSTVGFIAGGVATALGVTLLITGNHSDAGPKVGIVLAPGMAHVTGAF